MTREVRLLLDHAVGALTASSSEDESPSFKTKRKRKKGATAVIHEVPNLWGSTIVKAQ